MSRQIKFRAWDEKFKHWCIQDDIRINPSNGNVHGKYSGGNVKEWILMQYTGLKDKNGVEIYEGDIVKLLESGVHEKWASKNVVELDNKYLGFSPFCYLNFVNENKSVEVIGNIYENIELLEQ